MENPIKMDDLGVPQFSETYIFMDLIWVLFQMTANDSGPQVAVEMGRQDAVEALVDARVEPWLFLCGLL